MDDWDCDVWVEQGGPFAAWDSFALRRPEHLKPRW